MFHDPIVEEVRAIREQLAAQCNFDIRKIVEDAQRRKAASAAALVSAPPTASGAYPANSPQTPENMAATIYHTLGIPATAEWHDTIDRPYHVYNGQPIAGLI